MNSNFRNTMNMIETFIHDAAKTTDSLNKKGAKIKCYTKRPVPISMESTLQPSGKASGSTTTNPGVSVPQQEMENAEEKPAFTLDFTSESLLQGFIYSEIFGKPKCMRRGR